jgi:hypothetical protein
MAHWKVIALVNGQIEAVSGPAAQDRPAAHEWEQDRVDYQVAFGFPALSSDDGFLVWRAGQARQLSGWRLAVPGSVDEPTCALLVVLRPCLGVKASLSGRSLQFRPRPRSARRPSLQP